MFRTLISQSRLSKIKLNPGDKPCVVVSSTFNVLIEKFGVAMLGGPWNCVII